MNLSRRSRGATRRLDIEITPMIDVVFLLIVFFMTTAQFAKETRAEVDLPKERGEQKEESEEAGIVINIDASGDIIVAGRSIDLDELEAIVNTEARRPGASALATRVTVRADQNADAAVLNAVVERMKRAGLGGARLATEVPSG